MASSLVSGRVAELRGQRVPFVSAVVVRAERPTSAKPGDAAIVLADGTIEGFVGGVCAESSVRAEALRCLATGEAQLLRVVAEDHLDDPRGEADPVGMTTVANPCLSGGTVEIFLEPVVPAALGYVVGSSPIALALSRASAVVDVDLRLVGELPDPLPDDAAAVVVASHGRGEEKALHVALDRGVPYVALVASRRRGAAVLESLGLGAEAVARVHSPAGLDIGATTPDEVALSILAQIVAERRRGEVTLAAAPATEPAADPDGPATGIDPVCGMSVAAVPASLQVEHRGTTVYFCGPGCQQAFVADPDAYVS